jgi:hypothetical protein
MPTFNYDSDIEQILVSMSLSPYLPPKSSVGYGPKMTYSTGSGSIPGAITIYDDNIVFTNSHSLHIYIPTPDYLLIDKRISASLSTLVNQYSNILTKLDPISTQIIYSPGEITTNICSNTCYQGEYINWATVLGGTLYSPGSYTNLANRQTQRPIKGGVSITSTSHDGFVGTMGLVCQDSSSGALVGLTNSHVVINDAFYTSQRDFIDPQNAYDLIESNNPIQGDFVYQTGEITPINPGGPQEIGRVLRYVPMYTSASIVANPLLVNKVDAAIFSLYCTSSNGSQILNFTSSVQQLGLSPTSSMPFATTAEINNLLNSNPELYSSGRTTGVKGSPDTLCPLRFFSMAAFPISYPLQGTLTPSYFSDTICFIKPSESSSYNPSSTGSVAICHFPVWGGDSGSTLIAKISGVFKIIGLVFAGNGKKYSPELNDPVTPTGIPYNVASQLGYACRIDQVATQLGIKAWTGSVAPIVDNNTITFKTVSGSNSTKILNCSGSNYYQVGLTNHHNIC